ncbi:uncharacterized protein LOC117790629 [Drosophila innubila]|uniref:uncharacterized protein LOC117790629 n=1 Tax=Drosophila innubila TaxID=198719 RepID=UPI00148B4361|nr:uncharacterized protein LOC117790629 [Drosophila innubila]
MEDNSASVDQRWPLLHECCIQAVQLLAVQVRIERLAIGEQLIVNDSLPIPRNTQKNLPCRQTKLGHRLGSFTAFRPRPFALNVVVSDPLFIASHHPLQKRVDFVAIQKRFACIDQFSDFIAIFDDRLPDRGASSITSALERKR